MDNDKNKIGLLKLREPFSANQISKLPKPTKAQTEAIKVNFKDGVRCEICGAWHHPKVVHLDYVGHAALTDRLLDCDPEWNWHPLAMDSNGLPFFDANNGLWISLTVCGVTRLGYGHAGEKQGGDAIKEAIGDALRNGAMRGGAALALWHKGELHSTTPEPRESPEPTLTVAQHCNLLDQIAAITPTSEAASLYAARLREFLKVESLDALPVSKLPTAIAQIEARKNKIAESKGEGK